MRSRTSTSYRARIADAGALLKPMAEASRKDPGNGRFEVLQQIAPGTSQFTFVEIWSNKRQLENHQASQRTSSVPETSCNR